MRKIVSWTCLFVTMFAPHCMVAEDSMFSVRDSIQMTRFNDQPQTTDGQGRRPIVKLSPDRKYGVLLTSRGILESNQVESTLWLVDLRAVQLSLRKSGDESIAPPRALAVIAAPPAIDARGTGNYGSVISNVQWSEDSKTIYFLGENTHAERQLYSVKRIGTTPRSLTPAGQDVESFDFRDGTVAYLAASSVAETPVSRPGIPINISASVLTDIPIGAIFNAPAFQLRAYDLWSIHDGQRRLVARGASVVQLASYILAKPLVVSPDGRFVVMLMEAKDIPESWEQYQAPAAFPILQLNHKDLRPISPYNYTPLREYVVVDLRKGTSIRVGAVDARYFDYPGAGTVVWSQKGDRVLLTNVFLPAEHIDAAEVAKRSHPCEAAIFGTGTGKINCLVYSSTGLTADGSHLQSASFGSTSDQAVLQYGLYGHPPRSSETYWYTDDRWTLVNRSQRALVSTGEMQDPKEQFSIREGLNERPTLWVEDEGAKITRKMWDPNPRFASVRIGQGSVYRWKDSRGNEWTGGLFKPVGYKSNQRYPLVIQTHGFDPDKFMTDGAYPTAMAARALTSSGIMVLQVGGDGNASHIDSPQESEDNVQAFESAIDNLTADGLIDPKKVGIVGFSRTCWYVENALEKDPARFAAAILADGVSYSYLQYVLYAPTSVQFQREYEKVMGGSPVGKGWETWMRSAPDFHVDKIEAPLRIEAIEPVSVLQEWELYSSLKMEGKPVDLIYFPSGQHVLQAPLERFASEQGAVDWFRFWLQGEEDQDPKKKSQYERWRTIRESMRAPLSPVAAGP